MSEPSDHRVLHQTGNELVCACGTLLSNYGLTRTLVSLFAEHVRREREDFLAARVEQARAEVGREVAAAEREEWASWLESWIGAVGPEPPTPEAILRWLRADRRPFGKAQGRIAREVTGGTE